MIVSDFEGVQDLQQYFWSKDEAMAIGVERIRKTMPARGHFP